MVLVAFFDLCIVWPLVSLCLSVSQSDLEGDPFHVDEENDEMTELQLVVERLQSRDHNESLVRLAKDTGRKVFSKLEPEKRRAKIHSMVLG